ncbi:VOC family protein [Novosphingobium sp. 9]|uniref:VOC family protein n=1 Tax=Novosphingobium sp. 9 TaxID=2025349 RepID=UPI0021B67CFC|nr:VOC family protein [Novosphingobium sp. 9]
MLSHVTLGISDMDAARRFYAPLLAALGLEVKFADAHWAGWKSPQADRPLFVITRPFDGDAACVGNGQMIALLAGTRAMVDVCHRLALEHGGRDEGAPGLRPHYHAHYYGAYFRDPDGNKLCVCCHEPE